MSALAAALAAPGSGRAGTDLPAEIAGNAGPQSQAGETPLANASANKSSATRGWQYCLAPSHAEHKIYVSPPFPRDAARSDAETAFGRMLLQSGSRHDDVQCPIGTDADSISRMRQHAIGFNREAGNTVVTLQWDPSQPIPPLAANSTPRQSGGEPGASGHGWQYCFASSQADNKAYVSPLFPKSAALRDTQAAFNQMLTNSGLQHDDAQCPDSNDVRSIANMRQQAIGASHKAGYAVVAVNWNPLKSLQPRAEGGAAYSSSREPGVAVADGWQYCLAPSHAEHKVYISPLFPKGADLANTETAFDRMLLQSRIRFDAVQCPNGSDQHSISRMRQHAIDFNQGAGNTIVTLNWKP